MGGRKFGGGDLAGGLVGDQRALGGLLAVVAGGELGQVAKVVALPVMGEGRNDEG